MVRRLLRTKLVQDTLVLQAASFLQAGTYFLTSIWIAEYLGKAGLGRWDFARSLFLFSFFLVTMGVGNATVARYSRALAAQDPKRCIESLAALLKVGGVAFVAVMLLGFFVLPNFSVWWTGDREVGVLAWVLCSAGLFEVLRTLAQAALVGARQMFRFARFDITNNLVRFGLIYAVTRTGYGIEGIAAVFMLHLVIGGVLGLYAYNRAHHWVEPKLAPPPLGQVFAAVPRSSLRSLFGMTFFLGINKGFNDLLPRYGGVLIAGHSFADNGAFTVAWVITWGFAQMVGGVNRALLPALGFKIGNSGVPFEQLGRTFKRVTLASGCTFALLNAAIIPFVPWILSTFYGQSFADSWPLFLGLVVGNFFIGFGAVIEPFYIYAGRLKLFTVANLVWCGAWVVATTSISDAFGPKGVAVALGLLRLFVVFHLVYIWRYFRHRAPLAAQDPPP